MWVVIKREYIRYSLVQILRLIQQGLSMKGGYVLVEVDGEEVERSLASKLSPIIVLQDVVIVDSSFRSKWPNLLVAAGIAWYEEDWYSLDLYRGSAERPSLIKI